MGVSILEARCRACAGLLLLAGLRVDESLWDGTPEGPSRKPRPDSFLPGISPPAGASSSRNFENARRCKPPDPAFRIGNGLRSLPEAVSVWVRFAQTIQPSSLALSLA